VCATPTVKQNLGGLRHGTRRPDAPSLHATPDRTTAKVLTTRYALFGLLRSTRGADSHRHLHRQPLLARCASASAQRSDQNAHQFAAMLRYLPTSFVNERTRKRLVSNLGTPSREPPIWTMVVAVDKAAGDDIGEMLYSAYYTPLSTFFAHSGGLSLLRHVGPDHRITERPVAPWFHHSALNITDSSVALLAARVACTAGRDSEISTAITKRTAAGDHPVFAIGGRGLARAHKVARTAAQSASNA
jgi:hypothetical protein